MVSLSFVTLVNYSLSVDPELAPLPPAIGHGVALSKPVGGGWGYMIEADIVNPMSELHPGFQVLTGPSKKIGDHFAVGTTALYKFTPSFYEAVPSTHVLGATIAPIIPTNFGALSFPTGVAYVMTTDSLVVTTNVKVALHL